jgi:anti-sigma factor RsiW
MSRRLHLVDQPGNTLKTPAELDAYVKGRLDARARYNEQEIERRAAEQAAWRKAEAEKSDRRTTGLYALFVIAYVALVYGAVFLLWPR